MTRQSPGGSPEEGSPDETGISVRRIRTGEADLYRRLRLSSLRESPDAFATTLDSALLRSVESWSVQADAGAKGPDRATFFAFAGAVPVGIAALYRDPRVADTGELLQVWVDPRFRGTETGTALLKAVFEWAAASGFRSVRATVTGANRRAVRFYGKAGFRVRPDGAGGAPGDVVMLREVGP